MATIKDVAREASVSVATVSRVFSGAAVVRAETAQRIREVARSLRYAPHGGARSLITKRTSTIGVLLPDLFGEFFSELIHGIDVTARREGYHILVSRAWEGRTGIEEAMRAMRGRVDGLLVMSPDIDADTLLNIPSSLQVVLVCSPVSGFTADSVVIENFRGAKEMVRHLISLGHRRIAIIKGAAGNYDAAERLRGYRAALREARLDSIRELERDGDFTEASGYAATLDLLTVTPRPTAIFAANDSMAIGALSALRASGLSVPGEVAVGGFDDIPLAHYMDPPLTSVRVAISDLGARAVEILLHAIVRKAARPPRRERVSTELVIRQSTGAPYAERPPPSRRTRHPGDARPAPSSSRSRRTTANQEKS